MKKSLLVVAALCFAITASAQQLSFKQDVQTTYSQAMLTIAKKYNNAQQVIQLADEKSGNIVVKALFTVVLPKGGSMRYDNSNGNIRYTMTISQKDEETMTIEIENFIHETPSNLYEFGLITTSETAPDVQGPMSIKKWEAAVWKLLKDECASYSAELFSMFNQSK